MLVHIQKYQDELNELLYDFLPTDEMFMSSVNDSLCLKKEHITEFHDKIITASYGAMQKPIPYCLWYYEENETPISLDLCSAML